MCASSNCQEIVPVPIQRMPPVPWFDKSGSGVTVISGDTFDTSSIFSDIHSRSKSRITSASSPCKSMNYQHLHLIGITLYLGGEAATMVKLHLTPWILLLSASRLACATNRRPKKVVFPHILPLTSFSRANVLAENHAHRSFP